MTKKSSEQASRYTICWGEHSEDREFSSLASVFEYAQSISEEAAMDLAASKSSTQNVRVDVYKDNLLVLHTYSLKDPPLPECSNRMGHSWFSERCSVEVLCRHCRVGRSITKKVVGMVHQDFIAYYTSQ